MSSTQGGRMEYGASFRDGRFDEQIAEIAADPVKQARLEVAREIWVTQVHGDDDVCEYLADETWTGVLIGFLLGQGFTLDEAVAIERRGGFPA